MGFALCAKLEGYNYLFGLNSNKTFGFRARVMALGDSLHSQLLSLRCHLVQVTFGYCICLVMIGLLLFRMVNTIRLRLYLRAMAQWRKCANVGSVWYTSRVWKGSTKQLRNAAETVLLLLRVGMVSIRMKRSLVGSGVLRKTLRDISKFKISSLHSVVMTILLILERVHLGAGSRTC